MGEVLLAPLSAELFPRHGGNRPSGRVVLLEQRGAGREDKLVGLALPPAAIDEAALARPLGRARADLLQFAALRTLEIAEVDALPDLLDNWFAVGREFGDGAAQFGHHRNPAVRGSLEIARDQGRESQAPDGGTPCELFKVKHSGLLSFSSAARACGGSVRRGLCRKIGPRSPWKSASTPGEDFGRGSPLSTARQPRRSALPAGAAASGQASLFSKTPRTAKRSQFFAAEPYEPGNDRDRLLGSRGLAHRFQDAVAWKAPGGSVQSGSRRCSRSSWTQS